MSSYKICPRCKGEGEEPKVGRHLLFCVRCGGQGIVVRKATTKAQLWRRVARLAGELAFGQNEDMEIYLPQRQSPFTKESAIKAVLDEVHAQDPLWRGRKMAKLMRAFEAWEAVK